nr:hypothetical protein [Mycobacterium sp.]
MAVAGAAGDPSGPSARAADPLRPVGAPRADRLALPVPAGASNTTCTVPQSMIMLVCGPITLELPYHT